MSQWGSIHIKYLNKSFLAFHWLMKVQSCSIGLRGRYAARENGILIKWTWWIIYLMRGYLNTRLSWKRQNDLVMLISRAQHSSVHMSPCVKLMRQKNLQEKWGKGEMRNAKEDQSVYMGIQKKTKRGRCGSAAGTAVGVCQHRCWLLRPADWHPAPE